MLAKFNLVVAVLFTVILVGCGGGETTTTGLNENNTGNNTPAPNSPAPAPNPGNFEGTGTASLSWMPSTTYTDGSTIDAPASYNVYMDDGNGFVKIGQTLAGVSDYLVENLSNGTYTFAVTAYDSQGVESSYSNMATVTISS